MTFPLSETVKFLIALALGAALFFGGAKVLSWKHAAEDRDQLQRTEQSTETIIDTGALSDIARRDADSEGRLARDRFTSTIEEDNRNEPETGERADRRVPDSRLRAFRERREAREQRARERLERAGGKR